MKKRFGFLISLVVLALLVYVLKDVDFVEAYGLLLRADLFYLILAVAALGGSFLVWNLRWKVSLRSVVDADYFSLLRILMAGIFLNNITPGTGIGGEPLRAYYLKKKYGKSKSKFLGVILADKSFNYAVYLLFLVLSLLFVFVFLDISLNLKIIFQSLLLIVFIVIVVFMYCRGKRRTDRVLSRIYRTGLFKGFRSKKVFREYVRKRVSRLRKVFQKVILDRKTFSIGIALSFVVWVLIFLSSWFLFLSFGERVSFLAVVVVVTIGYLIGDLSPVPGGMGLMEGTMFLMYSSMGISSSLAVVVSLLSRIIYYFFSLIIGGLSLTWLRIGSK